MRLERDYENYNRKRGSIQRLVQQELRPLWPWMFHIRRKMGEMMEKAIEDSEKEPMAVIVENAERLSHEADTEGITGFMYGMAVSILAQTWEYGELLRKWHNKEYNYEGEGTVNPAIITVG